MSKYQTHNLPTEKFLTIATNILHKTLLEAQRTSAKALFKTIAEGKRLSLMTVRMEDDSELRFDMSLDHSEFRGKLNFGAFRASLQALIASSSELLQSEREITTFTEKNTGSVLFSVPGVTVEDGQVNAMMLACNFGAVGVVHLQLQYMQPDQFVRKEEPAPGR